MLKVVCNRCEKVLGNITPTQAAALGSTLQHAGLCPGVSSIPVFCFSKTQKVLKEVAQLELCEKCAKEYEQALVAWLPILAEVSAKMGQPLETRG